jgi:hypothetical protein
MSKSKRNLKHLLLVIMVLFAVVCMCSCVYTSNMPSGAGGKLKVVLSKYKENTEWVTGLKTPYIIYSKIEGEKNYIKEVADTESSTYLHHIIHNYDALDEWTLFAHAHETHWHHPTSMLNSVDIDLEQMEKKGIKFFSVNHHATVGKPIMLNIQKQNLQPTELTHSEHQTIFKDIFGIEAYNRACKSETAINQQKYPMCGQFFVHRSRILNRPKIFYERCLKLLQDDDHPFGRSASGGYSARKIGGFYFETMWHYIFGENLLYEPPIANYEDYPMKRR